MAKKKGRGGEKNMRYSHTNHNPLPPPTITIGFSNSPSLSSSVDRDKTGSVGCFSSPPPLPESSFSLSVEQADLLTEMFVGRGVVLFYCH